MTLGPQTQISDNDVYNMKYTHTRLIICWRLPKTLPIVKDDILKRQKERESRIAVQMRKLLSTSAELRTPLLSILAFHHLASVT